MKIRMNGRGRAYSIAAGTTAVMAGAAAAIALTAGGHAAAVRHPASGARLIASSCSGPAGAAYVSDSGWDGFSAIDTATCQVIQTYNVGDTQVPGDPGDYNYSSTNEGLALHGSTLYFADTGNSTVAVIDTKTLDPSNYNPAEKLINVGLFPQDLAVTPDGQQVWVAETGPQTSASSPSGISVISTATDKVTAHLRTGAQPSQIAFSPAAAAYVVTSQGLWIYDTATGRVAGEVRGLGDPRGEAIAPDGRTVYVTDTSHASLDVISTRTDRVVRVIRVGQEPWQVVVSANGQTVYVANPDSNSISVISAGTDTVTRTVPVTGDPDTLGLTPNGQQLWIGQASSAFVTVLNTADDSVVGSINLGGTTAQSGDGYEPTGIVLTPAPTAGS